MFYYWLSPLCSGSWFSLCFFYSLKSFNPSPMSKFRVQWSFEFSSSHKLNQCHYLNQKTRYRHHWNQFHQFIDFSFNLHDQRNHEKCIIFTLFYWNKYSNDDSWETSIYHPNMIQVFIQLLHYHSGFVFVLEYWIVAINTFSTKRTNSHIKTSKNRHESGLHKINFVWMINTSTESK